MFNQYIAKETHQLEQDFQSQKLLYYSFITLHHPSSSFINLHQLSSSILHFVTFKLSACWIRKLFSELLMNQDGIYTSSFATLALNLYFWYGSGHRSHVLTYANGCKLLYLLLLIFKLMDSRFTPPADLNYCSFIEDLVGYETCYF